MPRHVRVTPSVVAEHDSLLADLVNELKSHSLIGQPIILEDQTPQTNSIRVHVIWEQWNIYPGESRSQLIMDAYREAFGEETQRQITLALGVTVPEAVAIGLLPFKVVAGRKKAGLPLTEKDRQAMLGAGATMSLGSNDPQLRCATLEDAEATMEHLEQSLPNSKWIITEEVVPAE